jgi:hypothetical protein
VSAPGLASRSIARWPCRSNPVWLALLSLWMAIAGCGSRGDGLVEVQGEVSLGGAPLTTGVISLRPAPGNETPHHPTGLIDSQGHFRIYTSGQPGAPPGQYRVVVFATEPLADSKQAHPGMPRSIIPKRYNDASSTPLAMDVVRGPIPGQYDLKLLPGQ